MKTLTTLTLVAAAAALAALGGCQASEPMEINGLSWARYTPSGDGGDMARITGTIVNVNGCAGIGTGATGEDAMILVFATTDTRPRDMKIGDSFEASGGKFHREAASTDGSTPTPADQGFTTPALLLPDSCADATHFWAVNPPSQE